MSFNIQDRSRDAFMLDGSFATEGYDWWWHSFTAVSDLTGMEKQFFIEFFTCNPALGGDEPVFGQLPENKAAGIHPSYLMVKAGCWGEGKCQLHRFFGWNEVTIQRGAPFSIQADDCYASDTELRGSVSVTEEESAAHPEYMCDSGSMAWELTIEKLDAFNVGYGAGKPMRDAKAFEMYWHAEGMKSRFSGHILLNGESFSVKPERSFGYADKNWGRGFTSPWVWLASSSLTSLVTGRKLTNSAFDIGGGRPKVYGVPFDRKLLGAFLYEGEQFEFNFSKFWTATKTRFAAKETENEIFWAVMQETPAAAMVTKVRCKKEDMLLINYEAPDGSKLHNRLWNGGNGLGEITLYRRVHGRCQFVDRIRADHIGCEYGVYDK
jgi:hypothetical protein